MSNPIIQQCPRHIQKHMEEATRAFNAKKCVELICDGIERLVELHAFCVNSDGQKMMFVWQVAGGSRSGQSQGWKFLHVDKVSSVRISETCSNAPRLGSEKVAERTPNLAWIMLIPPTHHCRDC